MAKPILSWPIRWPNDPPPTSPDKHQQIEQNAVADLVLQAANTQLLRQRNNGPIANPSPLIFPDMTPDQVEALAARVSVLFALGNFQCTLIANGNRSPKALGKAAIQLLRDI